MSPVLIILRISVIVFVAEGLIMLVLPALPPAIHAMIDRSYWLLAAVDSIALVSISSPLAYFWVIRPYVIARTQAESRLRESESRLREAQRIGRESLQLLQTITTAANQASTIETIIQTTLSEICAFTGWPAGHAYLPTEEGSRELRSSKIWHLDDPKALEAFRNVSEDTRFAPGIGLPGRVQESGEPAWIVDVTRDENFPRARKAQDIGVKSGLAVPILVEREVRGVLEFFTTEALEPDKEVLDVLYHVGMQLGRVSERMAAQRELRESEARLKEAQRIARLGHWDLTADGKLYWSDEVFRIFGIEQSEFDGTSGLFYDRVHPDDRELVKKATDEAWASRSPYNCTHRIVKPDGEIRTVRECAEIISDETGKPVRSSGTIQDITEMVAIEERLRQAQKMEAVGQLTGGVAHDFNNLLAVIQGNAELLAEGGGSENAMMQAVLRASRRGAELTHRLLAFSRQQPLQPQATDLAKLVGSMTGLLKRTLGETIEIETAAKHGLAQVMADPGQIENALLNLAINARDAMPEGGKLIIECQDARLDEAYVARNPEAVAGDYVVLAVSDTGSGMSAEVQAQAFEPFFTTKEVGQGSGLGLSMVYGFAKQSGGHVTIYNEKGQGTTVKVYLPRAEVVARGEEESQSAAIPQGLGETILVIEDDADVRALAVHMLEGLGYGTISVADASSADAKLADGTMPDLVLSDVVLPGGISGPEFARTACETYPGLKVIFMSGYATEAVKRSGFLSSDKVLLNKPFQRKQLAKALREALD